MTRQQPSLLDQSLRHLYAAEQNVMIQSFWDCGWRVRIGDELSGYSAERNFAPEEFELIPGWIWLHIRDINSSVAEHEPERAEQFARSLGFRIDRKG